MRVYLLITVLFIASHILKGQEFDSTAWKYAQTITENELKEHLEILASDEYEGRETGRKGQKMAMQYLINEFKNDSIQDYKQQNYIQSFDVSEIRNEGVDLKLNGKELSYLKDYSVSPSWIRAITLSGEIEVYGLEDNPQYNRGLFIWTADMDKEEIKEIIDQERSNKRKAIFIYKEDLGENLEKYQHYYAKPRMKLSEELKMSNMPIVYLTEEGLKTLLSETKISKEKLEEKGIKILKKLKAQFNLEIAKPIEKLKGENVLAYIPGTDKKEELIVLTAHYDHIGKEGDKVFNGADDDGTGTVSLIEIAEAFMEARKKGHQNRRSILIMPVSGEEKGLLGSKYYTNHPIFPLENTVANLNVDMIGRYDEAHQNDSNYVYLIGSDKLSMDLHILSEAVNENYTNFKLDYTFNDENDPNRFYYRSDHYNFAKNNIPVIFYFSGVHEDYHKETDTVEKIDFAKTEKVARLIFLTAWELANREERIQLNKEEN